MGVTGPPGPVMDRDEVDRALARLGAEHEAIETSLLALQDHAGRRLLEGAELTGVTQERWRSAEASITLLWAYFDAYTDALRSARDIRSRRRWSSREDLVELTELLRGESVTVAGSATATANAPTLHGGPGKLSERFSLVTLVDRMNELYATLAGHGRRRRRGLVGAARPDRFTGRGAPAHPHARPLRRRPPRRAPGGRRPGATSPAR